MVKAVDCRIVVRRVWTPVTLLRSLSNKYPWERYEPLYPFIYGLNSATTSCLNFWDEAWWFLSLRVFQTIVFIFIIISTRFRLISPPTFLRYLSNSGNFSELRTTSFIESTGVTCSDSVSHNRVQGLSIPVLLLACSLNLQPPDDCLLWNLGNQRL